MSQTPMSHESEQEVFESEAYKSRTHEAEAYKSRAEACSVKL